MSMNGILVSMVVFLYPMVAECYIVLRDIPLVSPASNVGVETIIIIIKEMTNR